jgi:hypothetical protein
VSSDGGARTRDVLEERRGELAEQEGEDEGGGEEAAVGDARGAAGHGRRRRRAEVAGAARAGGRQARRAPHPTPILSLLGAESSSCGLPSTPRRRSSPSLRVLRYSVLPYPVLRSSVLPSPS